MLKAIFDWFRQPDPKAFAPAVQPEAAPYKVEAPTASTVLKAPAEVEVSAAKFTEELKSPSDLVVESLAPATTAPAPVAEVKKPAPRKAAPKAPAKPTAKPAAMKAPAKKPAARKPAAKKPQ